MSDTDKIRALIVDDEPLARKMIREFLRGDPSIDVIGEVGTGHEAVNLIEEHHARV
jgi:two-component system LytT family response regulator